jgi:hypothetical protein
MARIVVLLISGLRVFKLGLGLVVNLAIFLCKGFSGWVRSCSRAGGCDPESAARVEAIVGEEWGHAGGGVFGIVVREFSQGEDIEPVVLLVVAEDSEVLL